MGSINYIENITVTPLSKISVEGGDVLHAIKKCDPGFVAFGEAYFSRINFGAVKAWKSHLNMTMNLIVPIGSVKFVFFDINGKMREETIGVGNYSRITVPPGLWFGFMGIEAPYSLVLNISNILHEPKEAKKMPIDFIKYDWRL